MGNGHKACSGHLLKLEIILLHSSVCFQGKHLSPSHRIWSVSRAHLMSGEINDAKERRNYLFLTEFLVP